MKVASPVLKQALRELSPKLSNAELAEERKLDLSKEELARNFEIGDDVTVRDLKGIQTCTGLTELDLSDQSIEDLTPLAALN